MVKRVGLPSQGPLREPHALDQARCPRGFLSVSQRFPEPCSPTVSAARPSQSRLGAHQCWSRGPSRPNEPPHAGGAVHNSSRTGGRSARGGPRVVRCCRRRAVTPPPGSQFVSAVVSPGNRDSKRIPRVRRVGKPQRFPEPSSPTVAAAQPPTSRLAPSWGSRAGCPASTTPLTRAGQPPRRNQGAASRCAAAPRRLGAGQFAGTRPRWATRDEGR